MARSLSAIWNRRSRLFCHVGKKDVIFFGFYSNIERKYANVDNVYLEGRLCTKVLRPLNFGLFKHLCFFKIPNTEIINSGVVHSSVAIGDSDGNCVQVYMKKKHEGINYYSRKQYGTQLILVRSVEKGSNIRIVNIPMSPEYKVINIVKSNIACFLSKVIGKRNVVLMFEKNTSKANESGYYIFEKIMAKLGENKKVFFVIDRHCDDFQKVYSQYPNNTIIKYSFKHFLYIYLSKYFISSELPNHVINARLYIRNLNIEIAKKPFVFLQHGIMFAKPVDNPAASGFRKDSKAQNCYKAVISSELEATQFYKLGYEDCDLIKCGLPKFDVSKMNESADKILVMLTYRFWEEASVMNPDTIRSTTYFHTYMEIIEALEKEGLLDRLVISCHPKFSEYIIQAAPKYGAIVEKDINKALENSRIFITDFSSAAYDAHYRGAYIIYYWADKDYLIENYKAIPPINEENCDGVPVYDVAALVNEVKSAIENNYKMDSLYEQRYAMINEFHDNCNGDRLVAALVKEGIL